VRAPGARPPSRTLGAACVLAALVLVPLAAPALGDDAADLARQAAVAREQRAHEAQLLVARGRKLLASKAYAEARDTFRKALELRPGDATCRKLLGEANVALGLDTDRDVLQKVKERRSFTARAVARQLDTELFEAQRQLATDPQAAARRARRVVDGSAYLPDAARAADLRQRAQAIEAKAATEQRQRLDALRKQQLAKARADAHAHAQGQATALRTLREKGWKLLEDGDHEHALAAAEAMLRLAPGNAEALKLRDQVRLTRLSAATLRGQSQARREGVSELMAEIEKELTPPPPAKIVLPGKKPHAPRRASERPMEPWERELRAKLAQTLSMEFHDTPLKDAVRQISDVAGINVILDPEADTQSATVTIPRARMPAGSLLRWVARFGGFDLSLRDGAVLLARRGGPLDEPVCRVYDISSLVTPPSEAGPLAFRGPVEPLPHPVDKAEPVNPDPEAAGQGWVRYVRNTVAVESWDQVLQEQPRYTINYRNGRLVVVHTPEVHKEIEDLLNNFRRARSLQVHVLARFIEISAGSLEAFNLGVTADGNDVDNRWDLDTTVDNRHETSGLTRIDFFNQMSGGLNVQAGYTGEDSAYALLQAMLKRGRATILTVPRLTCFNTQRANLQVLTNINYVRRVTTDSEPEIGNIPEGIIFDVQPFVSADHRYITLLFQPQMRDLVSLVPFYYGSQIVTMDVGDRVVSVIVDSFVQIPTTRLRSMGTTVTVPNGGTLLMGGFTEVEERAGNASVPFLEAIPLVGRLLRSWRQVEGRRSLIILVTAETVPDIFEE